MRMIVELGRNCSTYTGITDAHWTKIGKERKQ